MQHKSTSTEHPVKIEQCSQIGLQNEISDNCDIKVVLKITKLCEDHTHYTNELIFRTCSLTTMLEEEP